MHRSTLRFAFVLASLCACGSSEDGAQPAKTEPAGPASAQAPAVQAAPAAPKGPAPAKIEEPMFRLAAEGDAHYGADQDAKFKVTLTALGGYHVNQDYPIRIELTAPDQVKLKKPTLGRPDAASFGEQSASFEVPFSAAKGEHEVSALVDFAVCTAETCVPDQRRLGLKLSVM
jgi:hypothetical protein